MPKARLRSLMQKLVLLQVSCVGMVSRDISFLTLSWPKHLHASLCSTSFLSVVFQKFSDWVKYSKDLRLWEDETRKPRPYAGSSAWPWQGSIDWKICSCTPQSSKVERAQPPAIWSNLIGQCHFLVPRQCYSATKSQSSVIQYSIHQAESDGRILMLARVKSNQVKPTLPQPPKKRMSLHRLGDRSLAAAKSVTFTIIRLTKKPPRRQKRITLPTKILQRVGGSLLRRCCKVFWCTQECSMYPNTL